MKTVSDKDAGKEVITTLQQMLVKHGFQLTADGALGNDTRQAVVEFQRKHGLAADGIAGYRTWEALLFAGRNESTAPLGDDDFALAAQLLDCSSVALKAVQKVETGGRGGFFNEPMHRPVILFEGHIFWNQLKKRGIAPEQHVNGNENILYPTWNKSHYAGGVKEYDRLEKARAIHREAADASASWGMFQIMGFNHAACGEKTVAGFVDMMHKSELHQLLLSLRFINANPKMRLALRQQDWKQFASLYNGPGYAANKYDSKLAEAYTLFSK